MSNNNPNGSRRMTRKQSLQNCIKIGLELIEESAKNMVLLTEGVDSLVQCGETVSLIHVRHLVIGPTSLHKVFNNMIAQFSNSSVALWSKASRSSSMVRVSLGPK